MIRSHVSTVPANVMRYWRGSSPLSSDWPLVICPMNRDGHCLFHCLLAATYNNYSRLSSSTQRQLALHLRSSLADRLGLVVNNHRVYDQLHNGELADFALIVPEFSLESMQETLRSSASVGHGYLTYICDQCHLDLYIINGDTNELYPTVEVTIRGRTTVIAYYHRGHYDLLALVTSGGLQTAVDPKHPLLQELHSGRLY